ncbi:MAG: tetratricopeptide repeat protein, partial [Methanothrix soehngenii]
MQISLIAQSGFCAPASHDEEGISCYNKGIDLAEQGRYDEAIAEFDRYIQDYPDYARAWYNKGVALTQQGKYEEALIAFDRVTDIEPQNSQAWY